MIPDAEPMELKFMQFNERSGPAFKMTNDPRVTPLGRVLRRFSLDELPQLWNILKGDMSFVGPRSLKPREYQAMQEWQRRKFTVVPGAISLWHVSGQPPLFDHWVRLDLVYIDTWSLRNDLRVFLKGLIYILSRKQQVRRGAFTADTKLLSRMKRAAQRLRTIAPAMETVEALASRSMARHTGERV